MRNATRYPLCLALLLASLPALSQPAAQEDTWWRLLFGDQQGFEAHRDRVLEEWRTHGSYYALLEIVEARIEPALGKIRREQVVELLGERRLDRGYPSPQRINVLVWSSSRLVPRGSYLVVRFNSENVATEVDWVSE